MPCYPAVLGRHRESEAGRGLNMTEKTANKGDLELSDTVTFLETKLAGLQAKNERLKNARAILLEQNRRLKQAIAKLSGDTQGDIF